MEDAKIEGFFTNHSLRRSGGTHLFNAGIDRKLVKEAMGHTSDAVDAYQITSEKQREIMSKVISEDPSIGAEQHNFKKKEENEVKITESNVKCLVIKNQKSAGDISVTAANVTDLIEKIMKSTKKGKTVIKLEIEIHND